MGIALQHLAENFRHIVAVERRPAGQRLVQHAPERKDVRAAIHVPALGLLRRHVRSRAENDARVRAPETERGGIGEGLTLPPCGGREVERLCQTEIEHLDLAVGHDLHVGGLQVAVHDALLVRGLERLTDLPGDVRGFIERQCATRLQHVGERVAFDELEHEEARLAALLQVVDRGNVLMVERGQRLGFALKPAHSIRIPRELLWQDLDGHVTFELRVAHTVDLTHAAFAQQRRDLVGPQLLADLKWHARPPGIVRAHPGFWRAITTALHPNPEPGNEP